METKLLSHLVSFTEPPLTPSVPKVVDMPPAEITNLVAIRFLYMNPAVRVASQEK